MHRSGGIYLSAEFLRFYRQKITFLFDTISEVISELIFIGGILLLVINSKMYFSTTNFALWYVTWFSIRQSIKDLHIEVRTDKIENLKLQKNNIYMIYSKRIVFYIFYSLLVLVLILILLKLPINFSGATFFFIIKHLTFSFESYIFFIFLTFKFERIETALNFIYVLSIYLSGMVIPSRNYSYLNFMNSFSGILFLIFFSLILIYIIHGSVVKSKR